LRDTQQLPGLRSTARDGHSAIAETFGFPDWWGKNWDAFYDCFADVELPARAALVWRDAELLAQTDLKTFAEAMAVLHEVSTGLDDRRFELFLLGDGLGFRRLNDPVDAAWSRLPI
jgi:RNAse (barnase) inhibitor barstar